VKSRLLGKQGPIELHSTFLQYSAQCLYFRFFVFFVKGIRFSLVIDMYQIIFDIFVKFPL
jgi:hypothetical protein